MFEDLTNFEVKRSWQKAIGFYIAYLALLVLIALVMAVFVGVIFAVPEEGAMNFGIKVGIVVATIGCTGLSYLVLNKKKLLKSFLSLFYLVATFALGFLGGSLLGLLVPAYLTTRESLKAAVSPDPADTTAIVKP